MDGKRRKGQLIGACLAVALLFAGGAAQAAPGDGLRSGNLQLHPGLKLGSGFDSNVYYMSDREQRVPQSPTAIIEPRLSIATVEPNTFQLLFDGAVTWTQYLTDDQKVVGQSGLSTDLSGGILFNPNGTVSLRLSDTFVRTNETPDSHSDTPYNRILNRAGARLGIHPGGRILESYLSYDFIIMRHSFFEDTNRLHHQFAWRNQWRFLPKTALVLAADFKMIDYASPVRRPMTGSSDASNSIPNVESMPLRVMGGITGLVTNRLSLRLLGGYGVGFYESGDDFQGMLGHVEASYRFGKSESSNRARLGYERNFSDSIYTNYYAFHRVYAGYDQGMFNDRLRLHLNANAQMRDYSGLPFRTVMTEEGEMTLPEDLSDLLIGAGANLSYGLTHWWSAEASYRFLANLTDNEVMFAGPAEDLIREYSRHYFMLSTTFKY